MCLEGEKWTHSTCRDDLGLAISEQSLSRHKAEASSCTGDEHGLGSGHDHDLVVCGCQVQVEQMSRVIRDVESIKVSRYIDFGTVLSINIPVTEGSTLLSQ